MILEKNSPVELLRGQEIITEFAEQIAVLQDAIQYNLLEILNCLSHVQGRVIVSGMGKSGIIARKFAATLASTGTAAQFVHAAEASHGDLGMITMQDAVVLLSNSGASQELVGIINHCKRLGIPIIGITQQADSLLGKAADYLLQLPASKEVAMSIDAPTTSSLQALAMCDVIAVLLSERRNFTKEDFKRLHPGGKIGAELLLVKDVMHQPPIVNDNTSIKDAVLVMSAARLGCVGINDTHNRLIGILTDGDLRRYGNNDWQAPIAKAMTHAPKIINENTYVSQALKIMEENKITMLFVTNHIQEPIGVVHIHDILQAKVV